MVPTTAGDPRGHGCALGEVAVRAGPAVRARGEKISAPIHMIAVWLEITVLSIWRARDRPRKARDARQRQQRHCGEEGREGLPLPAHGEHRHLQHQMRSSYVHQLHADRARRSYQHQRERVPASSCASRRSSGVCEAGAGEWGRTAGRGGRRFIMHLLGPGCGTGRRVMARPSTCWRKARRRRERPRLKTSRLKRPSASPARTGDVRGCRAREHAQH